MYITIILNTEIIQPNRIIISLVAQHFSRIVIVNRLFVLI